MDEAAEIAKELARRFEGLRLKAYYCPAGVITIGYGATGNGVYLGQEITKDWAEKRLDEDVKKFLRGSAQACPAIVVSPQTWAAVSDFALNLGLGALRGSTLRKRINAEDWDAAKVEIRKWVRGGGKILNGLVIRRHAESLLLK